MAELGVPDHRHKRRTTRSHTPPAGSQPRADPRFNKARLAPPPTTPPAPGTAIEKDPLFRSANKAPKGGA